MSSTEHDYDWLAFLYAVGEMSATESLAFEQQLAEDQSAREALARAVQLAGAVRSACRPMPVVRASSATGRSWLAVVGVCAAAALVLVATSVGFFDRNDSTDMPVAAQRSAMKNAGGLVAMWAESSPRHSEMHDEGLSAAAEFDPNCVACLDAPELSIPSWMLAAVAADPQSNRHQNPGDRREEN